MIPRDSLPGQVRRWLTASWRRRLLDALVGLAGTAFVILSVLEDRARGPDEPQRAILFTLALFAATLVLNEYLRPKPKLENARPAGLGDFRLPTVTEGRVVPLVWGRVKLDGANVTWYDDMAQESITKRIKTGLWSRTRQVVGFRYRLGMVFSLCRGLGAVALRRVWVGDKEVFSGNISTSTTFDIDEPDLFGGDEHGAGGIRATCEFYVGSTTQPVSTYLARFQDSGAGTTRTPRYTGECYVLARELDSSPSTARGADIGNSTSVAPWSFEVERFPPIFGAQSIGDNIVGGTDANPANVIYEVLTNQEWGFAQGSADVDLANFEAVADTLRAEGNGFAMVLDREMRCSEFLQEVQRQIDGRLFLDHRTGKWKIKLARADYTIGSVPQVNDDTFLEVRDFTRGTWEDTTNQITVEFDKRNDDYKLSTALAQDSANALIRGNGTIGAMRLSGGTARYPGVKVAALANDLAWRDLRGLSTPLARATFVVDRSFWDTTINDVIAWTSALHGFTQLPMRVLEIDYGSLLDGKIALTCVQDVFKTATGSYDPPAASNWTRPVVSLVAFPSDQQYAVEAPRGIVVRDPEFAGDATVAKVFAAARRQGGEVDFEFRQRNAAGAPSGAFAFAGDAALFVRIGELLSALGTGTAIPTATVTVVPDPDSQAAIESAFDDAVGLVDLGTNLVHLCRIGDEFVLVRAAANSGGNVNLQDVYRGVLDTAQMDHAAGTPVWLLFLGAGLSDTNVPNTNNVDVELRMRSAIATFLGSVTTISFAMAKRALRPYAAACFSYNGSGTPFGAPSLEGAGSGLNGFRVDVAWRRRDYRAADEVAALLSDAVGVDASTEYQLEVRADPDGANVLVGSISAWQTGTGPIQVLRLDVINAAAAGTELRLRLRARHDLATPVETDLTSRYDLVHDVVPTSALTGLFYLGSKATNVATNAYTAAATGTFAVNIGAAYATGIVEVQINSGGWVTVVAATTTTGTFSATASDSIELRHTVAESPTPNFVELRNPSSVAVSYGAFKS